MIWVLVGDDAFAIGKKIDSFRSQLTQSQQLLNFRRYPSSQIFEAIAWGLAFSIDGTSKIVAIEDCNFKELEQKTLEPFANPDNNNHLILTARSLDKRLKIAKYLQNWGKIQEFSLIPAWQTDKIAEMVINSARMHRINLCNSAVKYLAEAIGNDPARIDSEVNKLSIYANGKKLGKTTVRELVTTTTQTSLELANMLRQGNTDFAISLWKTLFSRGEHPLPIVASLQTQFRTWLIVKEGLDRRLSDTEITNLARINNPKRMYYLKQEVRSLRYLSLSQTLSYLLELEIAIKNGNKPENIPSELVKIARLFS
jgi:DNA polymerase-3 subunit delta